MNGKDLSGRSVTVNVSVPREPRESGSYGGGNIPVSCRRANFADKSQVSVAHSTTTAGVDTATTDMAAAVVEEAEVDTRDVANDQSALTIEVATVVATVVAEVVVITELPFEKVSSSECVRSLPSWVLSRLDSLRLSI